jgi:hypothetical protein
MIPLEQFNPASAKIELNIMVYDLWPVMARPFCGGTQLNQWLLTTFKP